ncbi:hypothetical protein CARUB_v10018946mg [Capsella rubella]|uniref:Uncharacterized protein n=1 Tax=Capsella rubella TaxID=81985 RepID=R0HNU3_9BRAS|nr:hypothetical protein CARUB_v10018946mg [Capsella rubella]
MNYIPIPLLRDIIQKVGKQGFRYLGPFVAAGPVFKEMVFSEAVLREVDLDEFLFNGDIASVFSIYRPFLLRCLASKNPIAQFVESVRLLTLLGPSQERLDLLGDAACYSIYARYAYGLFLICCGGVEEGEEVLAHFVDKISNFHRAVMIAEQVETFGFYYFKSVPPCRLRHATAPYCCEHCFAYTYASRMRGMC